MQEYKGLKIGDKVVVKNWSEFQPKIAKFVKYTNQNSQTNWDFETGYIRIELDWSEYGFASSNVNAHDENETWYRFSGAN